MDNNNLALQARIIRLGNIIQGLKNEIKIHKLREEHNIEMFT